LRESRLFRSGIWSRASRFAQRSAALQFFLRGLAPLLLRFFGGCFARKHSQRTTGNLCKRESHLKIWPKRCVIGVLVECRVCFSPGKAALIGCFSAPQLSQMRNLLKRFRARNIDERVLYRAKNRLYTRQNAMTQRFGNLQMRDSLLHKFPVVRWECFAAEHRRKTATEGAPAPKKKLQSRRRCANRTCSRPIPLRNKRGFAQGSHALVKINSELACGSLRAEFDYTQFSVRGNPARAHHSSSGGRRYITECDHRCANRCREISCV